MSSARTAPWGSVPVTQACYQQPTPYDAGMATPGPIGPFPPGVETDEQQDQYDRHASAGAVDDALGLYLVGSRAGERRNLMTLNWATQVAFEPEAAGHRRREAGGHPRADRRGRGVQPRTRSTARTGPSSASSPSRSRSTSRRPGTANGFAFHDGVTGAPILDQAPAWFDCEVRQAVDLGEHTFFIGEVVACGFQKAEDTPVLRMEDTRMNYGG